PAARPADADAFVGLHAGLVALDHLDVHEKGVARLKIGNVLAGREFLDLLFFELLDDIHREFSVGSASNRRAVLIWSEWVGELVLQSFPLVTPCYPLLPLGFRPVFGEFAGLVRFPEVGPALGGQPLRLRAPPGPDLVVVAGGQYLRYRFSLEDRRP